MVCLLKARTRLLLFLFGKSSVRQKKITRFIELIISLASWLDRDQHRHCLQMSPCRHCSLSGKLAKDSGGSSSQVSVSAHEPGYSHAHVANVSHDRCHYKAVRRRRVQELELARFVCFVRTRRLSHCAQRTVLGGLKLQCEKECLEL